MPYIRAPFASNGDKEDVPVASQSDGSISYLQGYPAAYSLDPNTDPSARRIERPKMNQLFFDITTAIKEVQEAGVASFITTEENGGSAFPYAAGAIVRYNGQVYQSLIGNNTNLPTVNTAWSVVSNQSNSLPIVAGTFGGNVNAITEKGIYSVLSTATNIPVASIGMLEHFTHLGGVGSVQIFRSANTSNVQYIRTGTLSAGTVTWTAWKKFVTTDDNPGRLLNVQVFTASGTYTPTAGAKNVIVELVGGGGGGGSNANTSGSTTSVSSGSGGGGGSYLKAKIVAQSYTVTIGTGGTGGAATSSSTTGNAGVSGGSTTVGALTAGGGAGGGAGNSVVSLPSAGNTTAYSTLPTGDLIVAARGDIGSRPILYSTSAVISGGGGKSFFAPAADGRYAQPVTGSYSVAGYDAFGYGGGGSGSASLANAAGVSAKGGNGAAGIAIMWEFA